MKKFTLDVQTLEENTGDDLDYIDDPKSVLDEIFGPKPSLTHTNEDKVLEKELSSDNIAPNKPVNLVSESPSLKVKLDEPSKQIESKLIPNSTKESSISKGLVRENSGNDNIHTKKRKMEEKLVKEASKKDFEEITSSNVQIESDKSNILMPGEINFADIQVPNDVYPMKTESLSRNKKCIQISVLFIHQSSDLKEERQEISSCVKEDQALKNQKISTNQTNGPKPVVEYCYGKNIPLHPNADIIRCKIVARGEEKFVKLLPNQSITRILHIEIDPNYKPCHNLPRIPFPFAKDIKKALISSQLCSNSVPTASQSTSTSAKSQSCSTPGENVQGPSTPFAIPEKPAFKNFTMKQGASFSGKTYGKSSVQSTSGQETFLVPSTTMRTTKAIDTPQGTIPSSGFTLLKPRVAKKKLKKSHIICKKSNLAEVSKHLPISKNHGHIKAVPQRLLLGKHQTNKDITVSKVPKALQQSGPLMKPPIAPAPKTLKPCPSSMKGSSLFTQSSSPGDQRNLTKTSASGHVERKISAKKLKHSPIILQKSEKTTKEIPVSSEPMPQSQVPEIVPDPSLSIAQGESPQTTGERVILLTLDAQGNCFPSNKIIPIVSNESRGDFVNSGSLININTANAEPGPQGVLNEALANTQVLQADTPELDDDTVFQQCPTTSLASSVLETSLILNQPFIMSPLEVPSLITTQPLHIKGKSSEIIPLLTDNILSDSSSHVSAFQVVNDSQIVLASSQNVLIDASNQIVFVSEVLPVQVESGSAEGPSHSGETKEDNVLPEVLKGE